MLTYKELTMVLRHVSQFSSFFEKVTCQSEVNLRCHAKKRGIKKPGKSVAPSRRWLILYQL